MSRFERFENRLIAFFRDRRGSVVLPFTVASSVMLAAMGGGVDVAHVYRARISLQSAADAAALTGAIKAKAGTGGGTTVADRTAAQSAALTHFTSVAATITDVTLQSDIATVAADTSRITSKLDWSARVGTVFSRVLGIEGYTIAGSATAVTSLALPTYVDIHFLIDTSHSMAIGATAADQATMLNSIGCTIACHLQSGTDTVSAARRAGAKLRLDVVKSAVSNVLAQAKTKQAASIAAGYGATIRVSLRTFSNKSTVVFPVSSNLDAAATALAAVDIDYTVGRTGTDYHTLFGELGRETIVAGDGKTAAAPKAYVVLMTDGVEDSATQIEVTSWRGKTYTLGRDPAFVDYSPYFRTTDHGFDWDIQGFDPSLCAPIKAKGVSLMTLDVEYLVPTLSPDASESRYLYVKNTLKPKIAANMAACASTADMALYASTSSDIVTAVDTLFRMATQIPVYVSR